MVKNRSKSLLDALLLPSSEKIGIFLGEEVERVLQEYRSNKLNESNNNICGHYERVCVRINKSINEDKLIDRPLEYKVKILYEWMEGASKVDPENSEKQILSSLWQALLFGIHTGNEFNSKLIDTLNNLREYEAKLLTKFQKNKTYFEGRPFYVNRNGSKVGTYEYISLMELKYFGLIKDANYTHLLTNVITRGIILTAFLLIFIAVCILGYSMVNYGVDKFSYAYMGIVFLLFLFSGLYCRFYKERLWVLTEDGEQLLLYAPEFS